MTGTGRTAVPAKRTLKLSLKNMSNDQTMRLVGGSIRYIYMQGKPIALEDMKVKNLKDVRPQLASTRRSSGKRP